MSVHPDSGSVMTVDGPIDPDSLGLTLTHEHILLDISSYCPVPHTESEREMMEAPLTIERMGAVRRDPMRVRDNTIIDDRDLALSELREFAELGGRTVVDVSPEGIRAGSIPEVADICRAAGLQGIVSSAYYVQAAHPPDVAERSVESIAEQFVREALEGHGDSGIRSGMIGEIGISQPTHPDEWKVLDAACRAQLETGLPLCIHPYYGVRSRVAPAVTRFVLERGVDPTRLNLCHMDGFMNLDYQRRILDMGAYISFDTFGLEIYYDDSPDRNHNAHDSTRVYRLLDLLNLGYADQLLISQDVCTKIQTKAYGGCGYTHIIENILPTLRYEGVDDATIDRLLIENPKRYMTIA
jgi:phosphotriesterase-related protein